MTALPVSTDPIDLPPGATIRRPDYDSPYVALSARYRWGKCILSAVLPQLRTPSGPAAEEGTEAHKVAEWLLLAKFKSANVGEAPFVAPPSGLKDFDYSPTGVSAWVDLVHDCANAYAQNAAGLFAGTTGQTFAMVEHKLNAPRIHGVKVGGIADGIFWNPGSRRLIVGDYKFGRSPVGVGTADDPNPQCAGAAVLWARDLPPDKAPQQIGLFVYQPRTSYGEPWQALLPLTPEWLQRESDKLDGELAAVSQAAAQMARGELPEPCPGDHCSYCPSARWCPAASGYGAAALDAESGKRSVVDLSPAEVMALWSARSAFKTFEEDLRERVKILHERQDPHVTVTRRAGNRIYANPAKVVEALMINERFDLLQPPGLGVIEGALPKAELDALLTRAPDVVTYKAADGKNPDGARAAFAKYLKEQK